MRTVSAIAICAAALVVISLLSSSAGAVSTGFTPRTSNRLAARLVEESQRSLAKDDRNPVTHLVNLCTARTWAQAAMHLAGEDAVTRATGVNPNHIVDRASRKLDKAVQTLNDRLGLRGRRRIRTDDVLVTK